MKCICDRISELPSSVISANIFKFLPLRDAVRTSVLSRRWRFVWTSVPELVFGDSVGFKLRNKPAEIIKRIFGILLLHQGPISTFDLNIKSLTDYSDIDKILIFLSRNGLQNLTMTMWSTSDNSSGHKLPSYIYSCTQLKFLTLTNSVFNFIYPTSFRKLVTLQLFQVELPPVVSITDYPVLEYLWLHCKTHIEKISIDLPNLEDLYFTGSVDCISFIDTPLLKNFRWTCDSDTECSFDLFKFLCSVPHIETLDLPKIFLKVGRNVAQNLPATMDSLESLEFSDICLDARDELSSALCLIRSSPNIQCLNFMVGQATPRDSSMAEYLEMQKLSGITLNQMCIVTVEVATCGASELELIKFLLAIAPELESLDIWPRERESGDSYCKMLIKLARFSRVSRKAELIYHDYDEEEEEEDD